MNSYHTKWWLSMVDITKSKHLFLVSDFIVRSVQKHFKAIEEIHLAKTIMQYDPRIKAALKALNSK